MSINKAKAANGTPDQQRELLVASQRKAQQAWQRLWMRIQSITPSGLLRFLLMVIALAGLIWLIASTFQSLAAFVIGIMLAYITLPVVNWLNRFLPRGLAVLLVILGEIALVALFFALLIPAVIQQLLRFLQTLPTTDQLRASFTQLAQQTQSWPQPVRVFLRGWLQQSTVNLQHNFTQYILGLVSLGARSILGLLSAFSFLLSLLVIPTWMFALLNDQRKGVWAVDRLLPDWLRPDSGRWRASWTAPSGCTSVNWSSWPLQLAFSPTSGCSFSRDWACRASPSRSCWPCWQASPTSSRRLARCWAPLWRCSLA